MKTISKKEHLDSVHKPKLISLSKTVNDISYRGGKLYLNNRKNGGSS